MDAKGASPVTGEPATLSDVACPRLVRSAAAREAQLDANAHRLAQQLLDDPLGAAPAGPAGQQAGPGGASGRGRGGVPELASVPLHLRSLRKAAVDALRAFNYDAALEGAAAAAGATAAGATGATGSAGAAKAGEGALATTAMATTAASATAGKENITSGGAPGHKPAVGLELATALNGLEMELLEAQRTRRKQQAEVRPRHLV